MNKKEKAKLLQRIASGTVSVKVLLPQKSELWICKGGVCEMGNGHQMNEEQFDNYRQGNPHIDVIAIQVIDTGVPLATNEADIYED